MTIKGFKTMILGLAIMLFGGFIMLDPSSSIGGLEFGMVLFGLLIVIYGFMHYKDE